MTLFFGSRNRLIRSYKRWGSSIHLPTVVIHWVVESDRMLSVVLMALIWDCHKCRARLSSVGSNDLRLDTFDHIENICASFVARNGVLISSCMYPVCFFQSSCSCDLIKLHRESVAIENDYTVQTCGIFSLLVGCFYRSSELYQPLAM